MNHEVFISYSSKDKAVADAVCHVLEQHNMQCWIAPRDVQPGARYAAEIVNGIKNCKVMVLVYSKESNQSDHVANEVDRAFNGGKTIIPFLVDDTPMNDEFDYYLSRKHWLVAYPHYADQLENLAHAVANVLGIEFRSLSEIARDNGNRNNTTSHQDNPPQPTEAEIHIEVDTDCNLYSFKSFLMKLDAKKDNVIRLNPGKYKLEFVSTQNLKVKTSMIYNLASDMICDFIEVKLKNETEKTPAKQKGQKTLEIETEVVWVSNDIGLVQDKNSGKYGIIRKDGEIVEPCQWTAIKNIGYKVYAFKTAKEEWIIYNLLKQQSVSGPWKDFVELEGGVIGVKGGNEQWGLITNEGKQISQCIWKAFRIATLKASFALVQDVNGKWGMINNSGELLSKCLWKDIRNFYEGLAPVQNENGKWGYIDTNGNNVIPCIWEKAYRFSNDRACVQDSNGKYGFINMEGHLVVPCKWQYVSGYFSVLDFDFKYQEPVVAVFGKRFPVGGPNWYVINKQGKIVDTVDTAPHEDNQMFGGKGIKVFKPILPDQGL